MRQASRTWKAHAFEYSDGTRYEVIDSTIDTDSSSTFSWNPSSFGQWNKLYLDVMLHNETSSGNTVELTADGITSGYRYEELNGSGGVNTRTGQSEFRLGVMQSNYTVGADVCMMAGALDNNDVNAPPCWVDWGGYQGQPGMLRGDIQTTLQNVTQVTLSTTGNAKGRVALIGELIGPPGGEQ
jgi:hypothetical protein